MFFDYEDENDDEDDLSKTELLNSKHDIRHLSSLLIPPSAFRLPNSDPFCFLTSET